MAVFFWLQRIHDDSVMFVTIDQEMRQQRLLWVVLALSCVIIISLLMLWRYTRFRSTAEAALIAETGFRRAMENSMSTGMRVLDMEGRIAYVNPAFCRMIGWNEADLIGRSPPFPYCARPPRTASAHAGRADVGQDAQQRPGGRGPAPRRLALHRPHVRVAAAGPQRQPDRLDDLHDRHHRAQAHPRGADRRTNAS